MSPFYMYNKITGMGKFKTFINWLKKRLNSFFEIFKDDNEYNEKTIIGFLAFLILTAYAIADLSTTSALEINEKIFDGFLWMSLGAIGIGGITGKFNKNKNNDNRSETTTRENKDVL